MPPDNLLLRAFADPTLVAELEVERLGGAAGAGAYGEPRRAAVISDRGCRDPSPRCLARVRTAVCKRPGLAAGAVGGRSNGGQPAASRADRRTGYPMLLLKGRRLCHGTAAVGARPHQRRHRHYGAPRPARSRSKSTSWRMAGSRLNSNAYDARYYRSMEPRAAAVAPPRSRQHARRPPYDPAAPVATASGSARRSGASAVTTPRRFAGALPDPYGAACAQCISSRTARSRAGLATSSISTSCAGISDKDLASWQQLRPPSAELGLVRPFYALRYASLLLGTPGARGGHGKMRRGPASHLHLCAAAMDPLVGTRARPDLPEVQVAVAAGSALVPLHPLPLAAYAAAAAGAAPDAQGMGAGLRRYPVRIQRRVQVKVPPSPLGCATRPPGCGR